VAARGGITTANATAASMAGGSGSSAAAAAAAAAATAAVAGKKPAAAAPPVPRPLGASAKPHNAQGGAEPAPKGGSKSAAAAGGSSNGASSSGGFAAGLGMANIDLSSAAVRAALEVGSMHAAQGKADVVAAALARTDRMEAVEQLEDRMAGVTSRLVTRWVCTDCVKEFERHPAACVAEKHEVVSKKRLEYAFACEGCENKTLHKEKLCAKPCSRCSKTLWKPCSVFSLKSKGTGRGTLDSTAVLQTHGDGVTESLRGMAAHEF
jgi:hypothetical protein